MSSEHQRVKLNVGGYRFETTISTLTSVPDTYFASLLSGQFHTTTDADGSYFVDRDGQFFGPILTFLRTHEVSFGQGISRVDILREAQFFCIGPLVDALTPPPPKEPEQPAAAAAAPAAATDAPAADGAAAADAVAKAEAEAAEPEKTYLRDPQEAMVQLVQGEFEALQQRLLKLTVEYERIVKDKEMRDNMQQRLRDMQQNQRRV